MLRLHNKLNISVHNILCLLHVRNLFVDEKKAAAEACTITPKNKASCLRNDGQNE